MLILTRRPGQAILIGPDVEVVVLDSDSGHVRIGIRAPRHVTVLRRELQEQVEDENRRAMTAAPENPFDLLASIVADHSTHEAPPVLPAALTSMKR